MNEFVGRLLRYLLICQIVLESASLTNVLHVVRLASLILLLYSCCFCFQIFIFSSLPVLSARRRAHCVSRLSPLRSSFHHRLLKGVGRFLGVDSLTALWSAELIFVANASSASSV